MANLLDIIGGFFDFIKNGFVFVFIKLPQKSIFPLVLLGGALVLVLLYLIFWYTQLYST